MFKEYTVMDWVMGAFILLLGVSSVLQMYWWIHG